MNIRVVNRRSDAMHIDEFLKILNFTMVLTLTTQAGSPSYYASLESVGGAVGLVTDGSLGFLGASAPCSQGALAALVEKISESDLMITGRFPLCFTAPKLMFEASLNFDSDQYNQWI